MVNTFVAGGLFMWPVTVAGLFVVWHAWRAIVRRRIGLPPGDDAASSRQAVLFWGVLASLLGVLGTTAGIAQLGRVAADAGEIPVGLAWNGVAVALTTSVYGFALLAAALLIWLLLPVRAPHRMSDHH